MIGLYSGARNVELESWGLVHLLTKDRVQFLNEHRVQSLQTFEGLFSLCSAECSAYFVVLTFSLTLLYTLRIITFRIDYREHGF